MKLVKKFDISPKEESREFKEPTPYNLNNFWIVWENLCPYGKYKNMSLKWIKDNDDFYYNFIMEKKLLYDWGFLEPKENPEPKKLEHFWSPTFKEYWIAIIEKEKEKSLI